MTKLNHNAVPIDLTAVIVAVTGDEPRVLTLSQIEFVECGLHQLTATDLDAGSELAIVEFSIVEG